MGFSRSHNNELNSVVRGRAGADTPMSIQDFDASLSIQDNVVPRSIRDDESSFVRRNQSTRFEIK